MDETVEEDSPMGSNQDVQAWGHVQGVQPANRWAGQVQGLTVKPTENEWADGKKYQYSVIGLQKTSVNWRGKQVSYIQSEKVMCWESDIVK